SVPGPYLSADVPNPTPLRGWEPFRLGGASLPVQAGETSLEVFLLDDTTLKVPGRLVFLDASGNQLALQDFCFQTAATMPAGTTEVRVLASPLVTPCPVRGLSYGPAVTGEILVTFR
ncbi:MAG: hypothetical protein R3185_07830, partial [Candidatus Thermoplasmatota archaeon]|nr:hypothetical protein [Candidatus Thermoplasmatota archaeon]